MKSAFLSSAAETQHTIIELVLNLRCEKHFTFVNKCVTMTSHLSESQLLWENATSKRVTAYIGVT